MPKQNSFSYASINEKINLKSKDGFIGRKSSIDWGLQEMVLKKNAYIGDILYPFYKIS